MINPAKLLGPTLLMTLIMLGGCSKREGAVAEAERNRKFQEMMTAVTLVGHSTRLDKDGMFGEERYSIDKVLRLSGDTWLFQTRLNFGSREIPVPIPLKIRWAGDTPVITLTDLSIPGVGTYTARVLLYRDQYAGTWNGATISGQLFGKIIRERKQQ